MKTKKTTSSLTSKPRRMWQDDEGAVWSGKYCRESLRNALTPVLVIPLTAECIGKLREKAIARSRVARYVFVSDIFAAIGLAAPRSKQRKASQVASKPAAHEGASKLMRRIRGVTGGVK